MSLSPLSRLIRTMSSIHSMQMAVRNGTATTSQAIGEILYSKEHFPKFLVATMLFSGFTGYTLMGMILQKQWELREGIHHNVPVEDERNMRRLSRNEAMIAAMIDHCNESSWRENLDNAFEAQHHFMLGSTDQPEPKLLSRIKERSDAILKGSNESSRWTVGE